MKKRQKVRVVLSSDDEDDDAMPSKDVRSCQRGVETSGENSLQKVTLGSPLATNVEEISKSRSTGRYNSGTYGNVVVMGKPPLTVHGFISTQSPASFADRISDSRELQSHAKISQVHGGTKQTRLPHCTESMLWVDKYAPVFEAELGLHKKKVQEVKSWFEQQVQHGAGVHVGNRVLLLTGPSAGAPVCDSKGMDKVQAVVQVLAKQFNVNLFELNTPVPTLWSEHIHNSATGVPYTSKLRDFEDFVLLSMKYPSLALGQSQVVHKGFPAVERRKHENTPMQFPPSPTAARDNIKKGASSAGRSETRDSIKFLLIEDLPMVGDAERKQQLADLMFRLANFSRFPTIIIISDVADREGSRDRSRDTISYLLKALERGGVKKIEFNPIAPGLLKKALMRVATAEKLNLSQETLKALADQSGGDIRHAISSLQFLSLGNSPKLLIEEKPPWDPGGDAVSTKQKRRKVEQQATKEFGQVVQSGIDSTHEVRMRPLVTLPGFSSDDILDLYHVLGKILYNKRLEEAVYQNGSSPSLNILEELQRAPLDMEEPEAILAHAHITTCTLSSFLYENVLDFMDDDAIEDAAKTEAYLSDCDFLQGLSGKLLLPVGNTVDDHTEVETSRIAVAAASSVAARGSLFAITHPAPRRFRQFRAPHLWHIERGQRLKAAEMSSPVCIQNGLGLTGGLTHWSTLATELAPFHEIIKHFSINNAAIQVTAANNEELQVRTEHSFDGQSSCSRSVEGGALINFLEGSFKSDVHGEEDEIED